MGSLSLNRKRIFNFDIGPNYINTFSLKFIDAPSRIISDVFDPTELSDKLDSTFNIYEGGINGTIRTILVDTFDFYDSNGNLITITYSIPKNSIIVFQRSNFNHNVRLWNASFQYTGYFEKYDQGKTSIKKQNLGGGKTIINRTGLYKLISTGSFIFVRGDNNTIGTFSNASEFTANNSVSLADRITIKSPGEGVFISYFLRADGITWRRSGLLATQNDTIIPHGSIIQYTTYNSVLKEFTVQGNNVVRVNPNA